MILDLYQPIKHFLGISDDDDEQRREEKVYPPKQPVVCAKPTDSLERILEFFVLQRVHRVYVVDGEGVPLYVIAPSDVLAQFKDPPLENKC